MKICVGDLEADGLLKEATQVHCGVFKDIKTGELKKFTPNDMPSMLRYLDTVDVLIMHNGIGYDWPLLEKLHGYTYKGKKVDTLIMSRLLNPRRSLPIHCQNRRAGPHSIEAWGYRVGRGKPDHDDWSVFSEAMLHRCTEDVEIQHLVYKELMREMKDSGADWKPAVKLTHQLFDILQEQEKYGWLVDKPYMERNIRILTRWIDRIDKAIAPRLPPVLDVKEGKDKGEYKFVKKPFKQDRSYTKATLDWIYMAGYDPDSRPVLGPYSRIAFRPLDLGKRVETINYLLDQGWEPKEWNTNDKGERTSPKISKMEEFIGVEGRVGQLISKRIIARQRRGILEGWHRLIRDDGRIPQIITGLAATGRATHKNIVNVPGAGSMFGHQMRKQFVCKEGHVIVGTDSAGCQDRMLIGRARKYGINDPVFEDMLLNGNAELGTDSHSRAAKAINEVFARRGLPLINRKSAKSYNYAYKFNAMDAKLGQMAGQTKEVGSEIRAALDGIFAAQVEVEKELVKEWKANARLVKKTITPKDGGRPFTVQEWMYGWFTGLDGRPIPVTLEKDVLVYALQSDEAIMMAAAYCFLYKRAERKGWKHGDIWGYCAWVHKHHCAH